jgi:hypothetical protein
MNQFNCVSATFVWKNLSGKSPPTNPANAEYDLTLCFLKNIVSGVTLREEDFYGNHH